MKTINNKKAISLIVLVITIIVMIVLAGAIVLTLNNSGIIDKAQNAVDKTNEAQVKQIAQLGWAEAYAAGARTEVELQAGVDAILEKNNIDTSMYGIKVTTSGVKVVKGWLQDGLTVIRGEEVLTIGDDFEYDETAEGTTDVAWKVLGASEEGELLIMSSSDIVSSHILGDKNYEELEECQNDWLNGAAELDGLCEPYGKGESATGARSIRVEDVNKITGYDPETAKDGEGKLWEYGNEVTYSYNGTTKPAYTATNGLSGTLTETHDDGFHYYNGTDFVVADLSTATGIIITLKSKYYYYSARSLETIDNESKAYKMIFGEDGTYYWLASPVVGTNTDYAVFGIRYVDYGSVNIYPLWASIGACDFSGSGVRAVVSLATDIQVTGDSTNGWSY